MFEIFPSKPQPMTCGCTTVTNFGINSDAAVKTIPCSDHRKDAIERKFAWKTGHDVATV